MWNCNPLVIVPNAELIRRGLGARRPVHRRPRAVPHRHGALRRHRAAGDHADRGRPTSSWPWGHLWIGLERGGHRAARRGVQQHRAVPPARRRDGLHRAGAVRRRRDAARAGARPTVDLDELRRDRLAAGPLPRGRPAVRRRRVPHAVGQGRAASASAWWRWASRRCRRSSPPREGRTATPSCVARYPLQLLTPKHHTRFLNSGYSQLPKHGPAEGGAVRRARRRRRRGAGPRRRRPAPGVQRPGQRQRAGARSPSGCGPASSPSRSAGGARQHPDGRVGQRPHQRHAHRLGRRRGLLATRWSRSRAA